MVFRAFTSVLKKVQLQRLERELEKMGGRQAYQSASMLSVSFHNTSKWVTQQLCKMDLRPVKGAAPLRVLEVMRSLSTVLIIDII